MVDIGNKSYLSQVRYLRAIAEKTIRSYPLKFKKLDFIQHGENTTFKLTALEGKFLVRVHREGYHSLPALNEELLWLNRLNRSDISAPIPIKNKSGKFVTQAGNRNITVLHWIEGRQIYKSVNKNHLKLIGELTASLHLNTSKMKVKHRQYWDAEGLAGKNPFMGKMDNILGLTKGEQDDLNRAQSIIFKSLKKYERNNPNKMGLIHADLHFGNFFLNNSKISPIDFDDCGYGFHMYDLAVTITSLFNGIKQKIITKKEYEELKDIFLNSYNSKIKLTKKDYDLIKDLEIARRFLGTQWLNLRADNPKLKKRSVPYAKETVKIIRKEVL